MSERYTKLAALQENLYAEGAPVIISAGNLLKDNSSGAILVQLKIKSIVRERIRAAVVKTRGWDSFGETVDEAVRQDYLDLSVGQGEEFGQKTAFKLPSGLTRGFSAEVEKVVFEDGSIWESGGAAWEPLPEPVPLDKALGDGELLKQYGIKYGDVCRVIPQEHKDLWQCSCGVWTRYPFCCGCGKGKTDQLPVDFEELEREKNERLAKEREERERKAAEEKARREAEEAARKEAEEIAKIAAAAARKKHMKMLAVAVPLVLLAAAFLIFGLPIIRNSQTFKQAERLFSQGEYTQAEELFESLGSFKAADERALACRYQEALGLMDVRDYPAAKELFDTLGDYEDSRDRSGECVELQREAAYLSAVEAYEKGKYREAKEAFSAISSYKESRKYLQLVAIKTAEAEGDVNALLRAKRDLLSPEEMEVYYSACYSTAEKQEKRGDYAAAFKLYSRSESPDMQQCMDRCNESYIEQLKGENSGSVKYSDSLNDPVEKGQTAASRYITISSLTYEYGKNQMSFTIVFNSTKACSMSFFDPPDGRDFMIIKNARKDKNTITITLDYDRVMSHGDITIKFFDTNGNGMSGYISFATSQFSGLREFQDLYGKTVKR